MGISTGPRTNNDGLVFYIDPGNKRSYSGAGYRDWETDRKSVE